MRYYFQIIAIESYKVWQDKVDGMVLQWYYDNVPEKVVEDRYVLQTLEQLPTKELECDPTRPARGVEWRLGHSWRS